LWEPKGYSATQQSIWAHQQAKPLFDLLQSSSDPSGAPGQVKEGLAELLACAFSAPKGERDLQVAGELLSNIRGGMQLSG